MKSFRDEAFVYYDFKPKTIAKRPKQITRKYPKQHLSSLCPSSIFREIPSNQSTVYPSRVASQTLFAPRQELLNHSFLNLESDLSEMQRAVREQEEMYEQYISYRTKDMLSPIKREVFEEGNLLEDRRKHESDMTNCFTSLLEDPTEKENLFFSSDPCVQQIKEAETLNFVPEEDFSIYLLV